MAHADGDPLVAASRLRAEADAFLQSTGMMSILAHHGEVHVTGSYAYQLMTCRDIDLCVATDDPTVAAAFRLGSALAALPCVGSMLYRNEFVMQTPGNPRAIFWCLECQLPRQDKWKVDVLLAGPEEVARVLSSGNELQARLTDEARRAILRVKAVVCRRPDYGHDYGAQAIYRAVMEENVRTVEEWDQWWALHRA